MKKAIRISIFLTLTGLWAWLIHSEVGSWALTLFFIVSALSTRCNEYLADKTRENVLTLTKVTAKITKLIDQVVDRLPGGKT